MEEKTEGRMEGRACRLTATGRKENEEKNPRKVKGKKKKAEIVRPDGRPTMGQLSLSRGTTSTPTPEDATPWEANWSDSVSMDDDDDDDDDVAVDEVGDAPPESDVGIGKKRRVGTSSTASSHFPQRGLDGRYVARRSSEEDGDGKKRKKGVRGDMSWRLTSESQMCSGGPVIPDVIPSFGGHIAFALWTSPAQDRGLLDCCHRSGTVESLRRYEWSSEGSEKVVEGTGLSHLAGCMMQHLDTALITAFVERWQPDTNTFHMPFGEMSILLHDVHHILGATPANLSCLMYCLSSSVKTFLLLDPFGNSSSG
ncbi:unnamed protein product [Linum trigynum]|uniref:Aminotransferase-like plant mobile domain-containing protein n=1 Tax=Linum trigynum TaxID=586398 RepID=A0AAV2DSI4_9ROSI